MNDPIRYTGKFLCEAGDSVLGSPHWEHPEGEWVKWEDYASLKAEVERLRKAGDAMASSIQFNEEMAQDYNGPTIVHQCVQRWNAAKEGKSSA